MSAASNYTEEKTLDFWLKANSATTSAPSTVYVALFNTTDSAGAIDQGGVLDRLESGTLTDECQGGGYQRQAVTFGTISGGSVSNSGNVTFPAATDGNWGTITHVAIIDSDVQFQDGDSAGQGNVLFYGALSASKTIDSGDTFQITTGNLTVSLA
jgi:hypothetical protein